jgi:hypothetical protein
VNGLAAIGFVLELAVAATAIIGHAGVAGEDGESPAPPGGRFRRFVERRKALGETYTAMNRNYNSEL